VKPARPVKLSRKEFLRELVAFAEEQRELIEASVSGFDVNPAASKDRVARARHDYEFFARTYFPHYVSAGVEPSEFQRWVYETMPQVAGTPGRLQAVAAPRGEGKSTLLTQIGSLYLVVYGLAHMVPLIMGSGEQAEEMLEVVKAELVANPRLRMDFPDAFGQGRIWRAGVIITVNGIKLKAFGIGKRIRGARNGPWRPDFVFLDDLENDENVRSKEQRDKDENWLNTAVLNLGPPDGSMRVMYLGTMLHYDSVLKRVMNAPRWKSHARVFRSIIQWPDRMDLWDTWEEVFKGEGEDAATAFFQANQGEMELGAVVSWPKVRTLYKLMVQRANNHRSFDTEQQNDPVAGEDCPFAGRLQYWVQPIRDWVFFGAHDPSMGKSARKGDPAATLVGGYDRAKGKLSVVEALIRRRPPDKQITDIIDLQKNWNCLVWGVEGVAFQEFFRTELVKRSAEQNLHVPARGINSTGDKDLRIEALQPHVANGLILFHRRLRTLIEQLEHWGEAEHDDGPDALEMLWQTARRGVRPPGGGARSKRRGSERLLQGYS